MDTVAEMIRNNPALESLVLGENFYSVAHRYSEIGSDYPFNRLMELIAANLNQLKELEYVPRSRIWTDQIQTDPPADHIIDGFFNSLKHLESLGLSSNVDTFMDFNELLQRLNMECKSIKHLKLYDIDGGDMELFEIIRSFEHVETLTLSFTAFGDEIEFLVEHLPFLRDLDIALHIGDIDLSFVLVLLRKCTTLEKLTVTGDSEDGEIEMFGTSQFYDEFIDSIQSSHVKMEVKFKEQTIGWISKNEVMWRNKLVRWAGCDQNSSNTNLLDLAKEPSSTVNAKQLNPFDLILGYLDLNSLCSLSETSTKCSHLVENYVKQHAQQHHGTFTITNEFNRYHYEKFAEYVTDLRANIFHQDIVDLQDLLDSFYNLRKLYIYTTINVSPHDLIAPQVRHLIYDGSCFSKYSQLFELSKACPYLEKLELKQAVDGNFSEKEKQCLEFRNLKKFTLKYHEEIKEQVKNLETIFKDTVTKLCLNI